MLSFKKPGPALEKKKMVKELVLGVKPSSPPLFFFVFSLFPWTCSETSVLILILPMDSYLDCSLILFLGYVSLSFCPVSHQTFWNPVSVSGKWRGHHCLQRLMNMVQLAFCICRFHSYWFNQFQGENILGKNCISTEQGQTFFLSLFPKQDNVTTIFQSIYIALSTRRNLEMINVYRRTA